MGFESAMNQKSDYLFPLSVSMNTDQCNQICFPEHMNKNPIFSLLLFEERFLIYYLVPNFVTHVDSTYMEETISQIFLYSFHFTSKKQKTFTISLDL